MSHRPKMPMMFSRKWRRIYKAKWNPNAPFTEKRACTRFAHQCRGNTSRRWAGIWWNQ